MVLQVAVDLLFYRFFEHQQEQAQVGGDANFIIDKQNLPVNAGPLEVYRVALPAVVYGKLFCKVPGQQVSRLLGLCVAHLMVCVDVNVGHGRPCGGM